MITRTASWLQQNGAKIFMKLKLFLSLLRRSVTVFRGGAQHGNFWFQFNFCQISKKNHFKKSKHWSFSEFLSSYDFTNLNIWSSEDFWRWQNLSSLFIFVQTLNKRQKKNLDLRNFHFWAVSLVYFDLVSQVVES